MNFKLKSVGEVGVWLTDEGFNKEVVKTFEGGKPIDIIIYIFIYIYIYIYVLYISCFRGLYALYKPATR